MTVETHMWQHLLEDASQLLNLEINAFCEHINNRETTRYFHANVHLVGDNSITWRLKVVNPWRPDKDNIQDCNSYNNCVHARLDKSQHLKSIVGIPTYYDVPSKQLDSLNCSELVIGETPSDDDVALIVDTLIKLRINRRNILNDFSQFANLMPRPINSYNRSIYRDRRLNVSIKSLVGKGLLSTDDANNVMMSFDRNFSSPLPENELTFVHGDFSYGNLKIRDGKLTFIDFEHSHIGIGELDIAHLFVNLVGNGKDDIASMLLEAYEESCTHHGIVFHSAEFKALVLERVAGKMNSMKKANGEVWERLQLLLKGKHNPTPR